MQFQPGGGGRTGHKLVETDKVLMIGSFGTPGNLATLSPPAACAVQGEYREFHEVGSRERDFEEETLASRPSG
jgi:hypothetical protein